MGKPDITNCLLCVNLYKFTLVRVIANKNLERGFYEKAFLNTCGSPALQVNSLPTGSPEKTPNVFLVLSNPLPQKGMCLLKSFEM